MLTKEECIHELEILKQNVSYETVDAIICFKELIKEHFEDKKTLKERFKGYEGETPKEYPWGDRYADECSKEEIDKWISEGYGLPPIREE